ncbi:MAG: biotin--[acetyl-CoA-carboxylase] ligase [Planctomycetota bacterium]
MILYTDMGEGAAAFFDGGSSDRIVLEEKNCSERADWFSEVFLKKPVQAFRMAAPRSLARFATLLLVENSPRSNLEILSELHRKGCSLPDGLVCLAYMGKGFMGRHDRSWTCEPGNLQAVVHLEPKIKAQDAGPAFSILAAVACVDALRMKIPAESNVGVKWVNDIMAGRKKIGGVLTKQTFQDPYIFNVFLGIGVNVLVNPQVTRNPFVTETGCLRQIWPEPAWSPGLFLFDFLDRLEAWYGILRDRGSSSLLEFYRRYSQVLGRDVCIYEDGYGFSSEGLKGRKEIACGKVEAIGDDLGLKIEGKAESVEYGRLAFAEDCREPPR